jgi:post-segregation antitoxin (ccd killing protein)
MVHVGHPLNWLADSPEAHEQPRSVYNMRMARLNVYVPDDLAARARKAGLNVSAITQAAIAAELTQHDMAAWVATLTTPSQRVSHEAVLAALDAGRGDFGGAG